MEPLNHKNKYNAFKLFLVIIRYFYLIVCHTRLQESAAALTGGKRNKNKRKSKNITTSLLHTFETKHWSPRDRNITTGTDIGQHIIQQMTKAFK